MRPWADLLVLPVRQGWTASRCPRPSHAERRADMRQRLIGIGLMIGAVACFACLDSSAKWLNRSMDPLQTAAIRYVGSFLLVAAFFNPWTRAGILRTHSLRRQCA